MCKLLHECMYAYWLDICPGVDGWVTGYVHLEQILPDSFLIQLYPPVGDSFELPYMLVNTWFCLLFHFRYCGGCSVTLHGGLILQSADE